MAEILIYTSWNCIFFPSGILAEAISMTDSDMFIDWIFYVLFLLAIVISDFRLSEIYL